nr:MAG TPA: hypothetical protein [Caudoviricetes sp.]
MLVPQHIYKFIMWVRIPLSPPHQKSPRNLF